MEIVQGLDGLKGLPQGAAVSIGNFDGVHVGHQRILGRARELAAGGSLAVVTFEPHPLTVLRPAEAPPRLVPVERKQELLEAAGVTHLVLLPPSRQVLDLEAEAFWALLRDEVRPKVLVEGQSFNFGKGRRGTIERLKEWAARDGVRLEVVEKVEVALTDFTLAPASSSLVRWLLAHGRIRDARRCLGRTVELEGEVVRGHQRGRTIGVPTANLRMAGGVMVPGDGVYAGCCAIGGRTYAAAVSIGTLPTFGRDLARQVEAHLLDFSGDLYGKTVRVELLDWVREQLRFNGVDALKAQIARDLAAVAEWQGGQTA